MRVYSTDLLERGSVEYANSSLILRYVYTQWQFKHMSTDLVRQRDERTVLAHF